MEQSFYAKLETVNSTSYDTNTLRVTAENKEGYTLRVDENSKLDVGSIYEFKCQPIIFKEKEQLEVLEFTHIDDSEIAFERRQELMSTFYEYSPVDSVESKTIIEKYVKQIENPVIKEVVDTIYKKHERDFYLYPAATKFHHAYIGGLSYHTSTMMKLIDGFMDVYPFLNKDLLIAGILLHDVLKVEELSNYAGPEYTKEGKLLGHITMGVKEIELVAYELGHLKKEEVLLLQHMILSHHYYGNYGSPKKTNIPEALILHFIDNIDSKMTVLKETLEQIEPGEFTPSIPVLDRERYYKSKL
ncbi:3'-5' exoribonuclease YhaM [Candidatus Izimaplasma bacterium HR1]|jgi:3'-5' exoribonuclease|uniref:3'-5' exoribonuclease YhaM family protein n=1 Tax=Candidatus Izimoplasma sp. HR1 TaxID=1541959 RepID=UPI0004F5D29B|nr:3'-5' exoribonuclease YhaM [Candidatus Izimaplasma bacterium HR1]